MGGGIAAQPKARVPQAGKSRSCPLSRVCAGKCLVSVAVSVLGRHCPLGRLQPSWGNLSQPHWWLKQGRDFLVRFQAAAWPAGGALPTAEAGCSGCSLRGAGVGGTLAGTPLRGPVWEPVPCSQERGGECLGCRCCLYNPKSHSRGKKAKGDE